jgi:hypothetical protein
LSILFLTFFSSPKESNKEKAPETISLDFRYARCTGLVGATLQSKLRAVSGSPPHLPIVELGILILISNKSFCSLLDLKRPQNILGGPSVKKLPGRQF